MIEKELHEQIAEFVSGKISFLSFQDWFVPSTWAARQTGSSSVQELIREIDLRLAEYTNDHLNDIELKERLLRMLISVEEPQSGTSANVDVTDWTDQPEMQIRSVHIGLAGESELQILLDV